MKKPVSKRISQQRAFTLIEIVLSLAVVAIAVISIMGLMTVFLQGTKSVVERNEALGVCQALNAYLQTQNTSTTPATPGFDKVYNWIQAGTTPKLYAFAIPMASDGSYATTGGIPQIQVTASTDSNYAYINNRIGRLYYISLSLSPNVPIHYGVGRTATYNPTSLPATWYPTGSGDAAYYADSSLALSVRVYVVPGVITLSASQLETVNFNYPILQYDTTVTR